MEKQISFSEGLVSVPYSDVSPDGQCSELHGLEVYTGSLKPCLVKGSEITDIDGRLLFIHKTNQYIHYIYRKDSKIGYYEQRADGNVNVEFGQMKDIGEFTDLSASGNILLFLREDDEPYAYLWDEGEYKNLGTMPELEMQFSLEVAKGGAVVAVIKDSDDDATKFDKVKGMYDEIEQEFCNKNGSFVFPFFARAAFKTFTGKYIKQTTPVLMVPNTIIAIRKMYRDDGTEYDNIDYSSLPTDKISSDDRKDAYFAQTATFRLRADLLSTIPAVWKPIIQSIDVFVTPALYPYDVSTKHVIWVVYEDVYNTQISKRGGPDGQQASNYHTFRRKYATASCMIPNITADEALEKSELLGYVKVASYGMSQNISNVVDLKEGDYNAIAAKQTDVLDNDYMTHDKIAAKSAFVYNKRTSVYNSKVIRYWGAGEERYQRVDYLEPSDGTFVEKKEYEVYEVVYEGGEKRLRYICDYFADYLHWWYCQNQNVKSIVVRNGSNCDEIDLAAHTTWGGAAYLNIPGYQFDFHLSWAEYSPYVTEDRIVDDKPNTIYTSAADNPFLYENVGETVVGTGTIVKLATMTTILSEGQAGQFDMIALTDIGNYALTLIKTGENAGLIQYVTPMRPDICTNKDSVCQDEGGIVMATANGLVLLTSNKTERLSDKLKGVVESEDEPTRAVNRPRVRPKDTSTLIAKYDIACTGTLTPRNQEYTFPSKRGNRYLFIFRPCDGYAVDSTYSLIINREYGPGGSIVNEGQLIADDIRFSNGIAQEYEWVSNGDNIDTPLRLVYKSGNPTTPARNYITLEIYPADNNFNKYDSYDTEGYHEVKPVGYVDSRIIAFGGTTDIKYKLKEGKKYIMVLDLRNTIASLSKPIILNAQIGQNVIEDRVLYFDQTFEDRVVVYSFDNQTDDDMAFLSLAIPNISYTVERLAGENATVQLWEEDDEDHGGGGGGGGDDDDDETWKDDYPMDDVDLTAIPPMQFLNECKILKDVVNNRLLVTAVGCNEYYQLSLDDGAWNTASFHKKVKVILNTYPFSYIQFDDNHIVRIDRDEKIQNGQDEEQEVYNGLLITRPVKMDSLLLKRITEFALQGNFEENQKITLWGSNDLKRWFSLGTTERRRVGAMRGYYFKYWRFTIQTCLKENEDISGLLVKYSVKDDGRFR